MGKAVFPEPDDDHLPLRLGLFGGTFNPIHYGHCQATIEVLRLLDLDRIYLIPSALPPHKSESSLATAEDRFEMVRLALREYPRLQVSKVELERPGPSYTIDTIRYYQNVMPEGSRIFFILGMDAFLDIDTWKSYRQLLKQADLIVMSRPGVESSQSTLLAFAQGKISTDYQWSAGGSALEHPIYHPIHLVQITPVAISSSQLRQMIRDGLEIDAWVAPCVREYITQKGLYR